MKISDFKPSMFFKTLKLDGVKPEIVKYKENETKREVNFKRITESLMERIVDLDKIENESEKFYHIISLLTDIEMDLSYDEYEQEIVNGNSEDFQSLVIVISDMMKDVMEAIIKLSDFIKENE